MCTQYLLITHSTNIYSEHMCQKFSSVGSWTLSIKNNLSTKVARRALGAGRGVVFKQKEQQCKIIGYEWACRVLGMKKEPGGLDKKKKKYKTRNGQDEPRGHTGIFIAQAKMYKFYIKSNGSLLWCLFFKWRKWSNEGKYFSSAKQLLSGRALKGFK